MQNSKNLSIAVIQKKVSEIRDISVETMTRKTRKREIVIARQLSMYFTRKFTQRSLAEIGTIHGGKDHSTVLHACRTIENGLDTKDPLMYRDYNRILDRLNKCAPQRLMSPTEVTADKLYRLKCMILNHVPLDIRCEILKSITE
jgi:hypothetical protein